MKGQTTRKERTMTNVRPHRDSRIMRPALLGISALVAAAALGGTAGPAAAHGSHGHKAASHQGRHEAGLGIARLYDGLLAVEGTNADDRIALRVPARARALLPLGL